MFNLYSNQIKIVIIYLEKAVGLAGLLHLLHNHLSLLASQVDDWNLVTTTHLRQPWPIDFRPFILFRQLLVSFP